ncbi:uncharacterized protein BO88DRAFT_407349 [Aspergillus vadensis CBS 113365]|uniref:Uncharacterized protein n=1 Tax=Aspergillus vadensis (strain CBS 113365 / IMI 142717 / IBT 24658) TaxID=1448311 RepID=A0A319B5N2_ASPVC|nr:hypothetical protein BO88DRAFT_407349 [Aspergillus vadensis CBS 113365]PYH65590.1 hypothetical protein BO88DRAFT_407349 [Aspergillus vadensis CBS 113365]
MASLSNYQHTHQTNLRTSQTTPSILLNHTWTILIVNSVSKLPYHQPPPPPEVGRYRNFVYDNHFLIKSHTY